MRTLSELEAQLTQPSQRLLEDLRRLQGDILILGVGGKMGPSLARLARRALTELGSGQRVIGVSRFSDARARAELETAGVETLAGDLLDEDFMRQLPRAENVIFMAGQKFGTQGNQPLTWAMNTYLPGRVAAAFPDARIVVFSTGNVYPFTEVTSAGASEATPPAPVGEYAQSCLGRERIFNYFSDKNQTPMLFFRLNYALDLRYGVLDDIARRVWREQEIDLRMGYVNVIWQGDANEYALRSLLHCDCPPTLLNVTGTRPLSVRELANRFGERMGKKPKFRFEPAPTALLSDARKMEALLGAPRIEIDQLIAWTVDWIRNDGEVINKPTHFQEREGKF